MTERTPEEKRASVLAGIREITAPDEHLVVDARAKWNTCAKPLGSLGLLEDQVVSLCAVKGTLSPDIGTRTAVLFCADNGVVEEGVTQTGSAVTRLVYDQLKLGRSSVNRMAAVAKAEVLPVDIGMAPKGTGNIAKGPAMTEDALFCALYEGMDLARRLTEEGNGLLIAGEMGIGNTTTSSAVAAVLLGKDPEEVTGKGAGLSVEGLAHKVEVIRKAIDVNRPDPAEPFEVLRTVGGYDLAGMCGLYLGGALYGTPVIMDGFPSAVAALCATRICPAACTAILPSHVSAEPAGQMVLEAMGKQAPITAGMRLGEGTGGVALLPLLDMVLAVFEEAYTFEEGGIEPYREL
ncbi:MAG: nicotinate-nucleotide--dimethylbenzimidazole phosphoribosyltransferase [Clostridia bacterium]|nr:nicotinate-nucleotide--dimethylbenzimidazole phosphoribosyltransferase [Clostridia bacterium]